MKKWQAKDFAKLGQVSVRTLHHYDKIGLLKPSLRLDNNYRLYSEKDLLKLQQIIALKFFGFKLTQIQKFVNADADFYASINMQSKMLKEQADAFLEASKVLDLISAECETNKSIPWTKITDLIEVFKMTQKITDTWVKDIFTQSELEEYIKFETELKANATSTGKQEFIEEWHALVAEFENNLTIDPKSDLGIKLGKKILDWVNKIYGKEYAHLRDKKFKLGFSQGKGLKETGLTAEVVTLMDQTMDAYFLKQIFAILDAVRKEPEEYINQQWQKLMDEAFGNQEDKKLEIVELACNNPKISLAAQKWLQKLLLNAKH